MTRRLLLCACLGSIAGSSAVVQTTHAATAPESGTESTDRQRDEDGSTPWGAIVAGCLGVAFGGAIAAWQIRGLSKRK